MRRRRMRSVPVRHYLAAYALLGLLGQVTAVLAASARYVGAIEDGPLSPTAVVVTEAEIAILEPYRSQLVLYSASGVLDRRIDFTGEARGLARLDATTYAFCDREGGRVVAVDPTADDQADLVPGAVDPVDLVWDGAALHVLDAAGPRILVCGRDGAVQRTVTLELPAETPTAWFAALTLDEARGIYYGVDQVNARVVAWSGDGAILGSFGSFGGGEGEISRAGGITCDAGGWVYVADRFQGRIAVFDADWRFVLNIDPVAMGRSRLALPTGVAVDAGGFLYVTATEGRSLQVFHLDKSDTAVDVPVAVPLRPATGDSVTTERPRLVASVRAPATATQLWVDFRLVAWPDSVAAIEESDGHAAENIIRTGDIILGEATWQPAHAMTGGERYGWQARARTDEVIGGWSTVTWFMAVPGAGRLRLEQNVPNPFNPQTIIAFELPGDGRAELQIFDVRGRLVGRTDLSGRSAGRHEVVWTGLDEAGNPLATGVYFYRLVAGENSVSRKMVLVR